MPALLPGSRCYIDASTSPDQARAPPTIAGLRIFILNFQVQPTQTIYIQATLTNCSSVLMVEAASLALTSCITQAMHIHHCNFLSDCQQLVYFLSKDDLSNPPDCLGAGYVLHDDIWEGGSVLSLMPLVSNLLSIHRRGTALSVFSTIGE